MMKNKKKRGLAVVLAVALVLSAFVLPKAYAASKVVTSTKCSIEINVSTLKFKELSTVPVIVNLYKVANISELGEYTGTGAFESLDFTDVDDKITAEAWKTKADAAKALVTEDLEKTATITLDAGTGTASNLDTGLYLIDAQTAESETNKYEFQPYLISLPNNYYNATGNDTWDYNLTGEDAIGLKPAKSDLLGDLEIVKTLDAYNETIDGATFVFQVEAVKKDADTGEEKNVYSNVVSMRFKGPGTEKLVIEDIPAGAVVTVTEIYTGASYELTSEASKTETIVADQMKTVTFDNTFNNELKGGNGIVNSFIYDDTNGSWTHKATEDSTP